ncbi:MAG: HAD-IC family P-type ATPase, partial [Clostridiales Family XIII bacterium]|nr:HAD-IC family P-type ATPase [Clostridiales Family XIII bacterium]
VLRLAAAAEQASTHPIAAAILAAAGAAGAGAAAGAAGAGIAAPTAYEEIAGKGLRAVVNGSEILAGSGRLMDAFDIAYTPADRIGTAVYAAEDGRYAGCLILEDEVKPDSKAAAAALRSAGVTKLVMLSGDNDAAAGAVAAELGLDAYFAELLPDQKVERLEMVEREAKESSANAGTLVYVGDGINDAPVLARADVGVAMGGLGSDAAIEAADAVLMTDEPSKLAVAIRIAKKTHGIVLQNIVFALGVKGLLLVLGALGLASMWAAVFGDVGVALIAILNAMRALRAA